jgi:hypothetical protein
VVAQGPDKVLPADSAQFPGLARAGALCQDWWAGTLPGMPQPDGPVPAATVALMRLAPPTEGLPTPPLPSSPAAQILTSEPQEDSAQGWLSRLALSPRDTHALSHICQTTLRDPNLTFRPLPREHPMPSTPSPLETLPP